MGATTTWDAIDDFAGPGGWSVAVALLGLTECGYEWDKAACETARAAGFHRCQEDVSKADGRKHRGTKLYIASPPCTLFSTAGKGTGRDAIDVLASAIRLIFAGIDCRKQTRDYIFTAITHPARIAENEKRSAEKKWTAEKVEKKARDDAFVACLVLEPARRILEIEPEMVAMEQVPAVLPLWQVYADELTKRGWSCRARVLNAADYGVPQTRKRAIFIGRREGVALFPAPTHAEYPADIDLFGEMLEGWVSMADALGWGFDDEPSATVSSGGAATGGAEPFANANYRKRLALRMGNQAKLFGHRCNSVEWVLMMDRRQNNAPVLNVSDVPAPTLTSQMFAKGIAKVWWQHRPTVSPPGYRTEVSRQNAEGGVKITVAEGGVLQSFPVDYPWQGSRSKQFEQVGNAIPPLLAAHILSALTGIPLELEAAA